MTTSEGKAKHKYKLRFMPEALDEWRQLDGSVKTHLKKLLAKRLDNPHVPGGELHGPLAGCYKIKLRQQGARLVYSVEDDHLLVTVVAVNKREDGVVYESAVARLSAVAAAMSKALRDKLKESGDCRRRGMILTGFGPATAYRTPALYLALEPQTAVREYQQLSPLMPPGTLVSYTIRLAPADDTMQVYDPTGALPKNQDSWR